MTRAAAAELTSVEPKTVPRVGYLVYRVERRLRDGLSCAQLARWAMVTPQAMNLVIAGLERRRLVRRRPDPKHRPVLRTSVTPNGLEVLARCDHAMDGIEADMLGDMAPQTVEVVRAALGSFAHSPHATNPPPRPRPLGGTR
ncbi:MAG TPA: hypothetical protein VEF89_05450 [Solirubrobacteraceae bacterium]|nr:hypothetical protein [Solirubrobacteraceae bacterium]